MSCRLACDRPVAAAAAGSLRVCPDITTEPAVTTFALLRLWLIGDDFSCMGGDGGSGVGHSKGCAAGRTLPGCLRVSSQDVAGPAGEAEDDGPNARCLHSTAALIS